MFKFKKRSARGINNMQTYSPSKPNESTSSANMATAGESRIHADDAVIAAAADTGAVTEPFVFDLGAIYEGQNKVSNPLLTPLPSHKASQEQQDIWPSDDDQDSRGHIAPAPPDFTRRGIHIPSRTSSRTPSANRRRLSLQRRLSADASSPNMPIPIEPQYTSVRGRLGTPMSLPIQGVQRPNTSLRSPEPTVIRSSADSVISYDSSIVPSIATAQLVPLQEKPVDEEDRLSPLLEDDPRSFDLVAPAENEKRQTSLEDESESLFSKHHLQAIFNDTPSLLRFTSFLSAARPKSIPVLIYYLDALKALRAINYANAVAEALEPIERLAFTETQARSTVNATLEEKANNAFDIMVRDDLPAFVTHVFTQVASVSISKRVIGNLPPMLREASEGLAEVFCLTDPSRADNPIIFASEEFHRTTQYGVNYAIGRNCRFLQGPKTNKHSVARFKEMLTSGKEHSEVFLNYRRDGSPFMNLLMVAPLLDSRGTLRYFIGAQIDVTGLVKDGASLEAFQRMRERQQSGDTKHESKDEFQELCRMFNDTELDMVRRHGGTMHRQVVPEEDDNTVQSRPRVLIQDQSTFDHIEEGQKLNPNADGKLSGPYKHYLLVRPAPSLRILFSSPSLRVPGILQSPFLDRIGGSNRVRASVGNALADGSRGVTAKIRWLSRAVANLDESYEEGRPRWIHCTPLLGASGSVGVWMVVLIDEDRQVAPPRRLRQAPPIANDIRSARNAGGVNEDYDSSSFDDGFPPRTATRREVQVYSSADVRPFAADSQQPPQSPRQGGSMLEQRAVWSPSPSIQEYTTGRNNGSTDTFDI